MRKDRDLIFFLTHHDWYVRDESGQYFIPTEKAPPEAAEAMKRVNERTKWDIENDAHSY